jgi:hypothetical protein
MLTVWKYMEAQRTPSDGNSSQVLKVNDKFSYNLFFHWSAYYLPLSTTTLLVISFLTILMALSPLVYNHTTCYIILNYTDGLIFHWSAYYLPLSTTTLLVISFLTILMALSPLDQPIISPCLQPHYLLYHS